jgi:RNA polymerase sigma-70 factor (ECF subfamily)
VGAPGDRLAGDEPPAHGRPTERGRALAATCVSLASTAHPAMSGARGEVGAAGGSAPAVARAPFDCLVGDHHPAVYRFLYRLCCGHRQDAEDLCQETFLRAYRAFGRLEAEANHRAWLCRIAYNAFLNGQRRARPTELPEDLPAASDDGRDRRELVASIATFVHTLPPKQRAAMILRHVEGREYDEVARVLGCSEDSARANVFQAVRKVRARFEKEYRTP